MIKIGTITYHNNLNRGALLQAYSLCKALQKIDSNISAEVIDYRTTSHEIKRIYTLRPSRLISKILDFSTPIKFLDRHGMLSDERILTNNHNKAISRLQKLDYDMIIVGSDQIWSKEKSNRFFPTARPFPNAHILDPKLDCLKASYAASASGTDFENLSESSIKTYKKHLSAFDEISVRDEHTEDLLEKIGITGYYRVPDPTILIDLPQKDLTDVLEKNGVSVDKPILNINQCGKLGKHIADYYREKGYQIVSLYKSKYSDYDLWGEITPLEYYSIHDHFDFVVSGSLHSTIFSIKNDTPFATLDFSPPNLVDKKETLLEDFSHLDRHIKISEIGKENVFDKIEKCKMDLDKNKVEKRLKFLRNKGIEYIKELEVLLNEKDV